MPPDWRDTLGAVAGPSYPPVNCHREFVDVFDSALGWMAIVGQGGVLRMLTFGHRTPQAARRATAVGGYPHGRPRPWHRSLAQRLQAYAAGRSTRLDDVSWDATGLSRFRCAVLAHCQRIPWGTTISYAQLAARAGYPHAARAVGTVMAGNRTPLVVPCHRVIAATGGLGGYSAPQGIAMKRRLLQLEGIPIA
ncbi:MAG: hypothetical protein A2W31_13120 [Planctomycetes bacterium RBG_16_64_10]|nr:MAG: hypothetical protein A2W31_13120 [Planctomycetes bacterium RBG_16_64_10]